MSDYTFLRDRGYAPRPARALVGDRYRLRRRQRTILYRAICTADEAAARRRRLVSPDALDGRVLVIDGYNVLLILYHYLVGHPVFLCRDGLVRDAGLSHGRSARPDKLQEVAGRLFGLIRRQRRPRGLLFVLDEAVSHSRDHAGVVRTAWAEVFPDAGTAAPAPQDPTPGTPGTADQVPGRALQTPPPDFEIVLTRTADADLAAAPEGILATSDSQVIDRSPLSVVDLPRWVLEESFGVPPADYLGGR